MLDSFKLLGCRVDACDYQQATEIILAKIASFTRESSEPMFVVTIGTEMVVRANHDPAFQRVLSRANLSLCDTIGVLLFSRLRFGPLRSRVTGVTLVEKISAQLSLVGGSIFLVGGAGEIAFLAGEKLAQTYPGLRIAGARSGYFREDESETIALTIRASNADVVFAGLGSPRQEFWVDRNLRATGCAIGVGVGGSFDVISGRTSRAPSILQALGLEWLYRLIREPHRWRRQLALPYFVYLAVVETMMAALPWRSARR